MLNLEILMLENSVSLVLSCPCNASLLLRARCLASDLLALFANKTGLTAWPLAWDPKNALHKDGSTKQQQGGVWGQNIRMEPEPNWNEKLNCRNRFSGTETRTFLLKLYWSTEKPSPQRNRRNRQLEPLEPFHARTVTEPNQAVATLEYALRNHSS